MAAVDERSRTELGSMLWEGKCKAPDPIPGVQSRVGRPCAETGDLQLGALRALWVLLAPLQKEAPARHREPVKTG